MPRTPKATVAYFKAANIKWGPILPDNTVKVSFAIITDKEKRIASGVTVRGRVFEIQQLIERALKERSESIDLYREIRKNKSLDILMTQQG